MDPITRDFYEERRHKWRRSAFWRGFFVALGLLLIIGIIASFAVSRPFGPHIARIHVRDVIYTDLDRDALIREIAETDTAAALIVHLDSPGGTVVGSEGLYLALKDVAARKPVVAVMDGVAASGAYLAALGADHIVARGNTITGSVGVIFEYLEFSQFMARVGVGVETIRSSELKAGPSLYRPLDPEARAAERAIVDETYAWFRTLVADERGLGGPALDTATDGRTFTGRMALSAGLIDRIGDEEGALAWIESVEPGLADLPVETWAFEQEEESWLQYLGKLAGFNANLAPAVLPDGPRLMSILK